MRYRRRQNANCRQCAIEHRPAFCQPIAAFHPSLLAKWPCYSPSFQPSSVGLPIRRATDAIKPTRLSLLHLTASSSSSSSTPTLSTRCPPGSNADATGSCQRCPSGTYSSSRVSSLYRTVLPTSSASQPAHSSSTSQVSSDSFCQPCPKGTYGPNDGVNPNPCLIPVLNPNPCP